MGISFTVPADLVDDLKGGALDSEQVWVQFICQTGPLGQHDPDEEPDDHVRPSHAAFHGCVFKLEDAPIPPLDYGCRCGIRYVAKPDSDASKVIDSEATSPPTTSVAATKDWLQKNVDGLDKLIATARSSNPTNAIGNVQARAKELGIKQPRAIAQMVVDITKAKVKDGIGSVTIDVGAPE